MQVEYNQKQINKRKQKSLIFKHLSLLIIIILLIVLTWLLVSIIVDSIGWLNLDFLTRFPSRFPKKSGILPGLVGSLLLAILISLIAIPVGVASAIYLQEYSNRNSWFYRIFDLSISNLSGVPSIIYGILGLSIFSYFTYFKGSLLAGGVTLSLLVLPVIIVASQEALKAVPRSLKEGAYALGMSKWQVIVAVVLPYALPSILTGVILGVSRAIGEGAPLIVVGAATMMTKLPTSLSGSFTALPIQIFYWTSQPNEQFQHVAAAASVVLIILLLLMNSIAIFIRQKYQRVR